MVQEAYSGTYFISCSKEAREMNLFVVIGVKEREDDGPIGMSRISLRSGMPS